MRYATVLSLVAVSMLLSSAVQAAKKAKPTPTPEAAAATPVVEATPVAEGTAAAPAATPAVEDGWEEPVSAVVPVEEIPDTAAPQEPAQRGTVAAPKSAVYSTSSKKGSVLTKLNQGTILQVFSISADREFVKVSVTQDDGAIVEGWMKKSEVRSLSRYGFSWERKPAK